jgi:hypothetical protein
MWECGIRENKKPCGYITKQETVIERFYDNRGKPTHRKVIKTVRIPFYSRRRIRVLRHILKDHPEEAVYIKKIQYQTYRVGAF